MKQSILIVAFLALAVPAHAQLGGLLNKAQQVKDAKSKFDDLNVTEEEERKIGEDVSAKIRQRFGVVQSAPVHKYVTLVGLTLAKQSERPALPWTFIVLDTDGVNAFASPGGIVHITRGALGLIKSEAELAGVLAHEIGHVAHKHTVNAIKKNKAVQLGTSETLSDRGPFLDKLANKAYEMVLENKFDRGDEMDADKVSVSLTEKAGYAPGTLAAFLTRLDERNKDQPAQNGLFASHPETKERIDAIKKLAGAKTGATVEARYKENIKYEPTPVTAIATGRGRRRRAHRIDRQDQGHQGRKERGAEEGLRPRRAEAGVGPERQTAQVSASGGSRGLGADRAAKGGGNPGVVKTTVSDADLAAFKKGSPSGADEGRADRRAQAGGPHPRPPGGQGRSGAARLSSDAEAAQHARVAAVHGDHGADPDRRHQGRRVQPRGAQRGVEPAGNAAKAMTFEQAVDAIRQQADDYAREFSGWSDEDFRREVDMFGRMFSRGALIVSLVINGHAAYRTQLFLYLKSCGRDELTTMNLWGGVDMPLKW